MVRKMITEEEKQAAEVKMRETLDSISDLPTLNEVAMNVNSLLNDPNSSASDLAKAVSGDPALSTKLLRVVNSALYALAKPVNSVNHAVVILGFRALRSMVLAMAVIDKMPKGGGSSSFNHQLFWQHSIATATAARQLAKNLDLPGEPEDYFSAGLLHETGMIVLVNYLPEMYDDVIEHLKSLETERPSLEEAEYQVLGCDHGYIGSILFSKWNLSQNLLDVIRHHFRPEELPIGEGEQDRLIMPMVIHCSDIIARAMHPGPSGRKLPYVSAKSFKFMESRGLDYEKLPEILEDIHEDYEVTRELLGI